MEVVEPCSKRKTVSPTKILTCKKKYAKRYVQPPRAKSFAPERLYKIPSKRLETNTTYHLSYSGIEHEAARYARLQPIRPKHTLLKSTGKFFDETTNTLSYRPIWQFIKTEAIKPKSRPMISTKGAMESVTTVRHDYVVKHGEKPEMIIPCGNIRTSSAPLEDKTMAKLSYIPPGTTEPTISFKPMWKYCPPSQPTSKETTQKLSYQPFALDKKELYPWMQKRIYKSPDITMCAKTTYKESYLENEKIPMQKPILPTPAYVFPNSCAEFADKTIYKESYIPSDMERPLPILPRSHITIPDVKMFADTTTKLSYQPVWTEKQKPILPSRVKSMVPTGKMQSETTTRYEYPPKVTSRPGLIVPCSNIRTADVPLTTDTTTKLSYIKPGAMKPVQSCKPIAQYSKPEIKVEVDTINKLSYQTWTLKPREEFPWAQKGTYQRPEHPMASDTIYHMSYPLPGQYIEDTSCTEECPCPNE